MMSKKGDAQRKRLDVVGELAFRLPITKVDNCNIADVLFISQIYNVRTEGQDNLQTRIYSSSQHSSKPNVVRRI